jgi:hypothetical protein
LEKTAKTTSLILILLLAPLMGLFADDGERRDASYYRRDGLDLMVEGSGVINTKQGWETYYFAFQPYLQLDTTHLTAYGGLQLTNAAYDFSGGLTVWPLVGNKARAGISARYNMSYYDGISLTHNILLGGTLETRFCSWLGMKTSLFAMLKRRSVFAIDEEKEFLNSLTFAFSGELDFFLPGDSSIYLSVASYERYRYMIAVAPSFTLGTNVKVGDGFHVGVEGTVRYTDFFTASTYYDGCEVRIFVGRTF